MVTFTEAIAPIQPPPAHPVVVTQITYELPTGSPDTVVFVISAVINDVSCVLVSLVTTNADIINSDHDDNGVVLIEHTVSENFLRRTYILADMTTPNLIIENQTWLIAIFERRHDWNYDYEIELREMIVEEVGIAVMAVYNVVNPVVRN